MPAWAEGAARRPSAVVSEKGQQIQTLYRFELRSDDRRKGQQLSLYDLTIIRRIIPGRVFMCWNRNKSKPATKDALANRPFI